MHFLFNMWNTHFSTLFHCLCSHLKLHDISLSSRMARLSGRKVCRFGGIVGCGGTWCICWGPSGSMALACHPLCLPLSVVVTSDPSAWVALPHFPPETRGTCHPLRYVPKMNWVITVSLLIFSPKCLVFADLQCPFLARKIAVRVWNPIRVASVKEVLSEPFCWVLRTA